MFDIINNNNTSITYYTFEYYLGLGISFAFKFLAL